MGNDEYCETGGIINRMNTNAGSADGFLLMDGIESVHHVTQTVCEAEKHPLNPVLPVGDSHEWDSTHCAPWSSPTVIYDDEDGLFKAWYAGSDIATSRWWAMGYAVSEDGINWHKPELGLYEYNGSKKNNIVLDGRGPIIKDDTEPDPNRRFKGIKRSFGGQKVYAGKGARANYSPDGVHWTEGPNIDLPEWFRGPPDIGVLVRDDQDPDPSRRYKTVFQEMVPFDKPDIKCRADRYRGLGRAKILAYGPDIENFRRAEENPLLSPADGLEYEDHHIMMSPYGGAWIICYEYGWYVPNGYGRYGMYSADIRLAVSGDGLSFDRVNPHQKVIARGAHGEWDGGLLIITDKPVVRDGTVYLFYGGAGEEFTSWPPENEVPEFIHEMGSGSARMARMGLATLREDGFTCLETPDRETPGHATTAPLALTDRSTELTLNVGDVRRNRNWLEVEVLDADSCEPVEGYGCGDCDDIDVDGLRRRVTWGDKRLAGIGRDRFRLRFHLYGAARLYGYRFV